MTEAIFPIPNQTRLAHPLEFVMLQIEVRQASVSTVLMKQTKPQTTDTERLNLQFFASQIQIPIPNKYLGCAYEGLVFVEIMVE